MAGELPASGPPTRRPATPWRRRAARCSPGRVARGSVGARVGITATGSLASRLGPGRRREQRDARS